MTTQIHPRAAIGLFFFPWMDCMQNLGSVRIKSEWPHCACQAHMQSIMQRGAYIYGHGHPHGNPDCGIQMISLIGGLSIVIQESWWWGMQAIKYIVATMLHLMVMVHNSEGLTTLMIHYRILLTGRLQNKSHYIPAYLAKLREKKKNTNFRDVQRSICDLGLIPEFTKWLRWCLLNQNKKRISLSIGNWRQLATMRTEDVAFCLDLAHKRQTPYIHRLADENTICQTYCQGHAL